MHFRFIRIASLVFALLTASCVAFAHPGRTDSNGGHHDRADGSYHYHHGYPAHSHDNGVCPYDFNDRTGWNSGASGSSSGKSASSAQSSSKPQDGVAELILLSSAAVVFVVSSALYFVKEYRSERKRELQKRREIASAVERNAARSRFLSLYGDCQLSEIAPPPSPDIRIGEDGLPRGDGPGKWGTEFTVYVTYKGRVFHSKPVCGTACGRPYNIVQVDLPPCSRCGKRHHVDLAWYWEQKRLVAESKRLFGRSIFPDGQ